MSAPAATRPHAPDAFTQALATADALRADGQLEEAVEFLQEALRAVLRSNRDLALLVAKLQRGSHRSERIDPGQLALLLEQLAATGLGGAAAPVDPEAEAREDAALDAEIEQAKATQPPTGRGTAPRQRQQWSAPGVAPTVHECTIPSEARPCPRCQGARTTIGHDVTRQLEFHPARFELHEYRQEKLACPDCKTGDTLITAEGAPDAIVERSAVTASVLAQVVVSKFGDHLPLTRQHRIYAREGVLIPVSTMADWVGEVADLVAPLVERLEWHVLQAHLIQTDATGLPVLDPSAPGNIVKGTIWAYVGDGRDVVFRYTPTGEAADGPWTFLQGRTGYVQADAAGTFDRLFNGQVASAIEVGCVAHFRRKLIELQDVDRRVAYPIKLISRLYRVERLADARALAPAARQALRAERDPPILEKLQRFCAAVATDPKEPPDSKVAQAVRYGLKHWGALTRFVEDGRLPPDNNRCEQQLRGIALTRRNALFAGSHAGAERLARLFSLLRTCAQRDVPPLAYLTDVIPKLAGGAFADRLDELLPDRWLATRQEAPTP